jgi:hypothetical protein
MSFYLSLTYKNYFSGDHSGIVYKPVRITETAFTTKKVIDICAGTRHLRLQTSDYRMWLVGHIVTCNAFLPRRTLFQEKDFSEPLLKMDSGADFTVWVTSTLKVCFLT